MLNDNDKSNMTILWQQKALQIRRTQIARKVELHLRRIVLKNIIYL